MVRVLTEVCVLYKELSFLRAASPCHCSFTVFTLPTAEGSWAPCSLARECLCPWRDSLESAIRDPAWNLHPGARAGTCMDGMLESTNAWVTPRTRGRASQALSGHWHPSVWRFLFSHLRHFYKCLNNFYHLTQVLKDMQSGIKFRVASSLPNKSMSRCKVWICFVGHDPRQQLMGWKSRAILKGMWEKF